MVLLDSLFPEGASTFFHEFIACSDNSHYQTQVDDYETILSVLAANVEKRKIRLADIRLREQRAKFAATLYTLSAWVLYVGLWYSGTLPSLYIRSAAVERLVKALPVVFGPIMCVLLFFFSKASADEANIAFSSFYELSRYGTPAKATRKVRAVLSSGWPLLRFVQRKPFKESLRNNAPKSMRSRKRQITIPPTNFSSAMKAVLVLVLLVRHWLNL